MAKVGLKETLSLLAAGYKKKDIEALAAIDDEMEQITEEVQPPVITDSAPAPAEEVKETEPDYKAMYEELLKKQEEDQKEIKEKDETIKKIQKENITSNSLPDVEKMREEEYASLVNAIRSFY